VDPRLSLVTLSFLFGVSAAWFTTPPFAFHVRTIIFYPPETIYIYIPLTTTHARPASDTRLLSATSTHLHFSLCNRNRPTAWHSVCTLSDVRTPIDTDPGDGSLHALAVATACTLCRLCTIHTLAVPLSSPHYPYIPCTNSNHPNANTHSRSQRDMHKLLGSEAADSDIVIQVKETNKGRQTEREC
jgi:hypothetical protein